GAPTEKRNELFVIGPGDIRSEKRDGTKVDCPFIPALKSEELQLPWVREDENVAKLLHGVVL
ncbi:MAG: hypothetical protein ACREQV_09590, partial [Candidatus Binatia bacterium]